MKKIRFTDLQVGFFVLIGVGLTTWIIFMLGSDTRLFNHQSTLYAKFKDISGLRGGATVQLAGFRIGSVEKIILPTDLKDSAVTVKMRIGGDYLEKIRSDSVATINTSGLLGDKFIYISIGGAEGLPLKDGDYIVSEDSTAIYELAEKAGSIMDDIGKASKSLSEILTSVEGEKKGDLKAILGSLRTSMEKVEKGKGLLHALIYSEKGDQMMDDLSSTFGVIRQIMGDVDKNSDKNVEGLLVNLRKTSANLTDITNSIKRGEGSLGKIIMDPELYNDLRNLLGRANRNTIVRSVIRSTVKEGERGKAGN